MEHKRSFLLFSNLTCVTSNFATSTSSTPTQLNKSSFINNMICSLRQHSGDGGHGEESGDENCQVGLFDRPTQSKDTSGQSAKAEVELYLGVGVKFVY